MKKISIHRIQSIVLNIFICFILSFLSSCSVFSPVQTDSISTYLLTDTPSASTNKNARSLVLLVVPPAANAPYRSNQMAYSLYPYQIAYFAKNRWAEPPAQMLYPLIIQTLQNTRVFHAVVTPSYVGKFDYLLKTQLIELQQDFTQHPTMYRIVVDAQLGTPQGRVIAVKQLTVEVPVAKNTPYSGVVAANRATVNLLRELTEFCLKHVH